MPSIAVLEHNQKPTDKPSRRIKRSGGQSLVRQCVAYWVIENVLLQMRRQVPEQLHAKMGVGYRNPTPIADVRSQYIPDKMPSHKAPGTCVSGPLVEKIPATCARILIANMIAAE